MLNDVTFGQYYPSNSFVHKLDSRVKLLLLIAYIAIIFIVNNFYGFLVVSFFLMTAIIFSKVPFGSILKSIRVILRSLTTNTAKT